MAAPLWWGTTWRFKFPVPCTNGYLLTAKTIQLEFVSTSEGAYKEAWGSGNGEENFPKSGVSLGFYWSLKLRLRISRYNFFLYWGTRFLILTSCWKLAVNLRVHFFVSNVASYFFNCLSHDGNNQNKTLEKEMPK